MNTLRLGVLLLTWAVLAYSSLTSEQIRVLEQLSAVYETLGSQDSVRTVFVTLCGSRSAPVAFVARQHEGRSLEALDFCCTLVD
jgi:hypothetical protein